MTSRKLARIARRGPWILDVLAPNTFFPLRSEPSTPSSLRARVVRRALIAARVRPHPFHLDIAPQAREDAIFFSFAIIVAVAVGVLVGLGTR
jgi:hypothetical protein